ncbi:MAG: tRNA pseudouridine(55) synthase TruB [Methylibium sp.]|uniref:tRNA pseudouridine(55) synthase TruB n=1 Tax=Methylibium sp. TaxID=2067992 RepID=UPI0017E72A0D|nr:tRNA pseudouridine(55) synthase TruB [Methylibium sp.]MBA2724030.1 tRNA pseudouridine(55) synthase TruB [Methylibium sp.]MBA3591573.1 tRNA pseudouridine(55) synthase TruB [Methylibium sp.]MBA3623431.1 tRNA pseudouridine(55) synthase TruB [Methylibium sp.]
MRRAAPRAAPKAPRVPRRALHGVLLLDKPLGWSSNDALQKVKGMLRAEKGGHTGTLDPLASGLLPLCFGAATKFSQASLEADKTYRATLQLGVTRAGGDREGAVLETRPIGFDEAALHGACAALTGEIDQLPPMHSALKHEGRALYEYARAGVEIERTARRVSIYRLDILHWQHDMLEIEVRVSKGTYIRSLAEDLGRLLGCGAHLAALRRTASGPLRVAGAITIDGLAALSDAEREARLLHPDVLLAGWPAVRLAVDDAGRFLSGLRRRVDEIDCAAVRVYGPSPQAGSPSTEADTRTSAFLGIAHVKAGELIPGRLLSPPEVQALLQIPAAQAEPNKFKQVSTT